MFFLIVVSISLSPGSRPLSLFWDGTGRGDGGGGYPRAQQERQAILWSKGGVCRRERLGGSSCYDDPPIGVAMDLTCCLTKECFVPRRLPSSVSGYHVLLCLLCPLFERFTHLPLTLGIKSDVMSSGGFSREHVICIPSRAEGLRPGVLREREEEEKEGERCDATRAFVTLERLRSQFEEEWVDTADASP
ncbi:uncharacterized protein BT62DRAFT_1010306 [Guyanagaster necrorhizus]|uniref:Uncharacterized protein n=1 Tax=Guyanagaster necrorhizus TaxID=856835 RepID=A0A9P8AP32_9AGAR|nr:uncharacterized protein BT62DRAFT_1010306 [Guyanagaster necrorhizus MCA 3950]KAG7442386.1 hypothetical protein BT62DRAFT_1010306 [Guyanagaster necrorhizus MCA 3950]